MAPKHKESECSRSLYIAMSRVHQIDVNLARAAAGWMEWPETIRRSYDASGEVIGLLRRQGSLYREFSRKYGAAPVWKESRELKSWYRSIKLEIEDMKGQSQLVDGAAASWQDEVYHTFLQAHRNEPHHPVWALNERLSSIELLFQELREIADTASRFARELEDRYTRAVGNTHEPEKTRAKPLWTRHSTDRDDDATDDDPLESLPTHDIDEPGTSAPFTTAISFIDEKVKHKRAATTADYVPGPTLFGSVFRRQGRSVPRIFTGSFRELEAGLREMAIDSAGNPKSAVGLPVANNLASVSSSFPVDPKRRPNLETDDDVVMVSRRRAVPRHPNDRIRAQTLPVNDLDGGLHTWLAERQPPSESAQHRDNTA